MHYIIDNNGITFWCDDENGLNLECTTTDDLGPKDIKIVMKTPQGVMLGDATKILDSFDICETVTFNCQTTFAIDCILSDLNVPGPWTLDSLIVGGLAQTVLTTEFSTRDELKEILINMGWTDQDQWVLTLSQSLAEPNNESYVIIEGSNSMTTQINLPINCQPDCSIGTGTGIGISRLVLTKDDDCNYCWLSPECLRTTTITNVISCCTGCNECTGHCVLEIVAADILNTLILVIPIMLT